MKKFMDNDFLLDNQTAKNLFNYVKHLPIIDYHCHVSPKDIAENKTYSTITELLLGGDHYKWRAMRNCGVDEHFITGDASDYDKFFKFASIMPLLIANPLFHWTHLELKKYFNIDTPLSQETAKSIYDSCNEKLINISTTSIINQSNVQLICTTDDPDDSLEYHKTIAADKSFKTAVLPTFRPDRLLKKPDKSTLKHLEERLDYFVLNGCIMADHGFSNFDTDQTFMCEVAKLYKQRGVTLQLHYGVARNPNTSMFSVVGADSGFDCIGDSGSADGLIRFLDSLNSLDVLPKTIIYSINPNDNLLIDTISGSFRNVRHGAPWWFNDTKLGMERHLAEYASVGALGNFIGMLTDSRSFLSYTRHDYFRRILCNFVGKAVENGEYTASESILKEIVCNISHGNAEEFLLK